MAPDVSDLGPAPAAQDQHADGRLAGDQWAGKQQLVRRDDGTPRGRHPAEVRLVGKAGVVVPDQ